MKEEFLKKLKQERKVFAMSEKEVYEMRFKALEEKVDRFNSRMDSAEKEFKELTKLSTLMEMQMENNKSQGKAINGLSKTLTEVNRNLTILNTETKNLSSATGNLDNRVEDLENKLDEERDKGKIDLREIGVKIVIGVVLGVVATVLATNGIPFK